MLAYKQAQIEGVASLTEGEEASKANKQNPFILPSIRRCW
jgi:hypothetical protein